MNILDEFQQEGLLERVVSQGGEQPAAKDLPKVDPNVDQSVTKIADVPDSEPGKAGDQNKDDDPTQRADEMYEDRMMEVAVKSMQAAEAAMAHTCERCDSDKDNRYDEGKKRKLKEVYESLKGLKDNLYAMATMEDYRDKAAGKHDRGDYKDKASNKHSHKGYRDKALGDRQG